MDIEEIIRRHELVTSSDAKELRKLALDYVVNISKGQTDEKELKGMLRLISFFDEIEELYQSVLNKRKEQQ